MSFQARTDRRENNNNNSNNSNNRTRVSQAQGGRGGRREWIPRGTNAVATTNLTPDITAAAAAGPVSNVVESLPAQIRQKPNGNGEGSSMGGRGRPNGSYGDFSKRSGMNGGGNRMSLGSRGQQYGRPLNQKREKEKDRNVAKDSSLPQLVQEIQEKLMKGTVECMICYDMVKRSAPVWSCTSCYSIFHLHCTKKWARAPTSVDLSAGKEQGGFNWRCPGCQSVQLTSSKEIRYVCFCRKREEPPSDLYLTPHSCGEPCGKPLEKEVPGAGVSKEDLCPHLCVLQCHPGPCPPCKAFAPPRLCPCGKKVITTRCSDRKSVLTCGESCDKLLDCWRHRCEKICHVGPCDTCQVVINASCFCKKKSEAVLCGDLTVKGEVDVGDGLFSCPLPCEKLLNCGNHVCTAPCHPGPCGDCELLPGKIKTCCCGKTSLEQERHSCFDPIPTCVEICSKTLPCGSHKCKELCHSGDCAPCQMLVTQKCRCGSTSRTVECYKTMSEEKFTCDKPCGHKKSCGRHRCSERCCPLSNSKNPLPGDWDPHLCSMSCGKKLRCGQHSCESLCHSGHCPPCPETIFSDLTCACGRTSIPPPQPCGTPPPSCQLPCSVAQSCGHSSTHSCHFGDCPPCSVPVAKECTGGHVVLRNIPCGSKDIRCNQLCGKTRQCGMHACARTCHPSPCDSSIVPASGSRVSCGQTCGAPRRDCRHTCSALCHPSSPCPDVRCEFRVTITCSCGNISATVPCDAGGSNNGHNVDSLLELSAVQKLPVPLQPVEANGKRIPLGQRKLTCDDECLKVERKRALADAFGITPNMEALHFGESSAVSEVLTDLFRRDPKWVLAVEERCKFLVLGRGRGGTSALKVHVFCPMLKEKRDAVRLIAERWKLSISAAGWEPKRFIVVHVTPKSKAPARIFGAKGTTTANMISPSVFDPLVDMDPRLVVALFELPSDADISALVLRFGGECELVWLNDKNALAVFSDPARAATAMRRLDQGSLYYGAVVLQNGGVPGVASGANAWGGSGVPKDGGSGLAIKGNPWKKAVVQEPDSKVSSWGDEEDMVGDSTRLEASVRKGNGVPIPASSNRWSILDAEIIPSSSTSIVQITDPVEQVKSQMVSRLESGASSSVTIEKHMGKDDQRPEVVEDWEKAYD
ncbi:NF-X1-type zinc finger protein NFXL1 [Apium graveolens]|uniref:NF-X1-type zinc finger protein NFXL1 n=1 Tax=Apium graveolens TaxID=4045 RepID=UPI003D79C89B